MVGGGKAPKSCRHLEMGLVIWLQAPQFGDVASRILRPLVRAPLSLTLRAG